MNKAIKATVLAVVAWICITPIGPAESGPLPACNITPILNNWARKVTEGHGGPGGINGLLDAYRNIQSSNTNNQITSYIDAGNTFGSSLPDPSDPSSSESLKNKNAFSSSILSQAHDLRTRIATFAINWTAAGGSSDATKCYICPMRIVWQHLLTRDDTNTPNDTEIGAFCKTTLKMLSVKRPNNYFSDPNNYGVAMQNSAKTCTNLEITVLSRQELTDPMLAGGEAPIWTAFMRSIRNINDEINIPQVTPDVQLSANKEAAIQSAMDEYLEYYKLFKTQSDIIRSQGAQPIPKADYDLMTRQSTHCFAYNNWIDTGR